MSILIANINFLSSLGITTSEQFMAAFGDMADFTDYCDEIGYSWRIDEDGDLILISPNGNEVNSEVQLDVTATPTITVTPGTLEYTIAATGDGTVKLYIDDTEVSNPVSIERTRESQEITITATAEEEGKIISEPAEEEITIPAIATTAKPYIDEIPGLDDYTIIATGDGVVKLYLNGVQVENPYTVVRTNAPQNLTFTATAQEEGKQVSDVTEEAFIVPALPGSQIPVITATQRAADYEITVTAGQDADITITYGGDVMANPFYILRGNADSVATVIAVATEPHHSPAMTTRNITIEALPVTATPTITVTPGLTHYAVEASGNGTLHLYADGTEVTNPYAVVRTTSAQTIVFTATAQEANHQISATATETVTVPAQEVTATPTISYDSSTYTVSVSGNGTVLAYVDGVLTQMPHTFTQGQSAVTYVVTATAQESGKQISATATENCLVPAIPVTDTPTITTTTGTASYTIEATGNGTVILYADGTQVANPYTVNRTTSAQTIVFTATAQESGKQISATATETVTIPAQEITATPTISYDSTTFTVDVSGNGTVLAYVDGVLTQMPHTFTQGQSAVTYVVTATAQESGKQISATATENCLVPAAVSLNYMKLSVLNESGNDGNITITIPATTTSSQATSLSYSKDGSNWTDTTVDSTAQTITIPVNAGDEVYLKGVATQWGTSFSAATTINSTANINASGNIMSMFYGDNFENQTSFPSGSTYNLARLFYQNSHLIDASQLELPATSVPDYAYRAMFSGCTSLTSAPTLPALILATSCYQSMFYGCTSLTTAPALPALSTAPYCFNAMYQGCTSLTAASTLAINYTSNAYTNWLDGISTTGTLTVNIDSPATDALYAVPANWTITPASTAAPTISTTETTNDVTITATGSGTVTLYTVSGSNYTSVTNPYVVTKDIYASTVDVAARARESGLRVSDYTSQTITIPAKIAYDFEEGGLYYSINGANVGVVTGENAYTGNITIPATVTHNGTTYNVTVVGNTFAGNTNVTKLVLPSSVTTLPDSCFANMTGLLEVEIPNVENLPNFLVDGCTSLTTLKLGAGVHMASAHMTRGCTALTDVYMLYTDVVGWYVDSSWGIPAQAKPIANTIQAQATLYIPTGTTEAYKTMKNTGYGSVTLWNKFATYTELSQ